MQSEAQHQFFPYDIHQIASYDMQERVWAADWDPTGILLATAGSSKVIRLYKYSQTQHKLQLIQTLQTQHTKTIRSLKFSPNVPQKPTMTNHPILATASFDSTISIWVTTLQQESQTEEYQQLCIMEGHQNQVKCVSWNHDSTKLASCSRDKNIWIWEFDEINYEYTCENVLEGHTQDVKYVQWITPTTEDILSETDLNRLASCSYDDTIRIWEMDDDDYICRYVLNGHNSIVWSLTFNSKCDLMVSTSEDCSIIVWGIREDKADRNYEQIKKEQDYQSLPIYCCKMLEQNSQTYLLTGSGDNSLKLSQIQMKNNKQCQITVLASAYHQSDINHISIKPNNNSIFVSCSDDETLKLWEITKSQQ